MKEAKMEVTIGLFVIIGLVVLGTMIVRLGSSDYFAYRDAMTFSVHFNFADGILEKAPVRYAGVEAGRVQAIRLTANPEQRVILDLVIKKGITVREGDFITINSLGLMSEMYVEIVPGDSSKNAVKKGQLLMGTDPVALQQVVTNAKKVLEELEKGVKVFSEDETKNDFKKSLSNVRQLSDEMRQVTVNLRETTTVMSGFFTENKDDISASIHEFKENIKGMRKSVDSMERILSRVERGEGLVGKLLVDKKTSDDFSENLEKMKQVLDDLHEISLEIREGEGTLGMFITDKEVAEKLKSLILDIEKNPWKLLRKPK